MRRIRISIGVGATVCASLLLAVELYATRPRTYREAVMQILDQRAILYADVQVARACTFNPRDCAIQSTYTAYIEVAAASPVPGRIVCERQIVQGYWDTCMLALAPLRMYNVPLPPLAHDPAWLSTLQRQISRITMWLRTRTQSR